MTEKAFTYYELQGTHPNITMRFVDVEVANNDFEQLKAICNDLCLTKYEFFKAEGYLLSPNIEVLKVWWIDKGEE